MRRNEFSLEEQDEIERFLQEMTFGFLGTAGAEGVPHITPLNYVYHEGRLYFHGSKIGEKMRELRADHRVSFAVAKEYALIPSYYSDPKFACPATSYFKSVHIRGNASLVENSNEKIGALAAFMSKLQPEGGYEPFTYDDPEYATRLRGVAVVRIEIDELTAKFKFGQNLPDAGRKHIAARLEERGRDSDEETARLMRLYCPIHRSDGNR